MIVFLTPILILFILNAKQEYLDIEYAYSFVVIIIPLLDLSLINYFFYAYKLSEDRRFLLFYYSHLFFNYYVKIVVISIVVVALIAFFTHSLVPVLVAIRAFFLLVLLFFSVYFRLNDQPQKSIYLSIFSNLFILGLTITIYLASGTFEYWHLFIGQAIIVAYFLFKFAHRLKKIDNPLKIKEQIKNALKFGWPIIIQAFLMMLVDSYGKIMYLNKLEQDEATILAIILRMGMVIQFTHAGVLAFLSKKIYIEKDEKRINLGLLKKYLVALGLALLSSWALLLIYYLSQKAPIHIHVFILCLALGTLYKFFWSIYSYLEIYFSRINANIVKLYVVAFNSIVFFGLMWVLDFRIIVNIFISLGLSSILTLLFVIILLRGHNFRFK